MWCNFLEDITYMAHLSKNLRTLMPCRQPADLVLDGDVLDCRPGHTLCDFHYQNKVYRGDANANRYQKKNTWETP